MHSINLSNFSLRTDLIIENKNKTGYKNTIIEDDQIKIETTLSDDLKNKYTTIYFNDITDKDNHKKVEVTFIKELKKYLENININEKDTILIVGLGNSKSTPDSLGPKTINQILVTRHLFNYGAVEAGYQNVAAISPEVTATTGIETSILIENIVKGINAKLLIIVDALMSSSLEHVNKIIQITNTGIHPGSGVGNNRKEISQETLNIPVIAIGIPTVVDATTIVSDTFKYMKKQFSFKLNNLNNNSLKLIPSKMKDYRKETKPLSNNIKKEILGQIGTLTEEEFKDLIYEVLSPINYNLIVTPTEIDFLIEKLSLLIASSINKTLHKHFNPTNTN